MQGTLPVLTWTSLKSVYNFKNVRYLLSSTAQEHELREFVFGLYTGVFPVHGT